MKLTPFDVGATCQKCGGDEVSVRYVGPIESDPTWYARTYSPVGKWPKHEYMHRTCKRCGYDWPELAGTDEGREALQEAEE